MVLALLYVLSASVLVSFICILMKNHLHIWFTWCSLPFTGLLLKLAHSLVVISDVHMKLYAGKNVIVSASGKLLLCIYNFGFLDYWKSQITNYWK